MRRVITCRPTNHWTRGVNGEAEYDLNDYSKDPIFMNNWTPNLTKPRPSLMQLKSREQVE
jgi:hypothetical protein